MLTRAISTRAISTIVAAFFVWVITDAHIEGLKAAHASGNADVVVESAGTPAANSPSRQIPPKEMPDLNQTTSKSVQFEPLLLLVLGSTLFSIGTAIKLIVHKKFKGKLTPTTTGKSPNLLANALQRPSGR